MKLSNGFAKLTTMKSKAVRLLAAATLAGAVLTVAMPAAEAQQFAVGVRVGGPFGYRPAPPTYGYGYGYGYGSYRYERFREHEEWVRHHEYRGYRHGYYR